MIVLFALWIKSCAASRTAILAAKIFGNRQGLAAVPAEDRVYLALVFTPNHWRMASQFLVAMNARVKCIATLESHRDDVALGMVVRTLGAVLDPHTADYDSLFHITSLGEESGVNGDW
jgi:hypothetical protein